MKILGTKFLLNEDECIPVEEWPENVDTNRYQKVIAKDAECARRMWTMIKKFRKLGSEKED